MYAYATIGNPINKSISPVSSFPVLLFPHPSPISHFLTSFLLHFPPHFLSPFPSFSSPFLFIFPTPSSSLPFLLFPFSPNCFWWTRTLFYIYSHLPPLREQHTGLSSWGGLLDSNMGLQVYSLVSLPISNHYCPTSPMSHLFFTISFSTSPPLPFTLLRWPSHLLSASLLISAPTSFHSSYLTFLHESLQIMHGSFLAKVTPSTELFLCWMRRWLSFSFFQYSFLQLFMLYASLFII